jgi:hypothetical protein
MQIDQAFLLVTKTPVDTCGHFYVLAHDDPCIGAADKMTPSKPIDVIPLHSEPPCRLVILRHYMRPSAAMTTFSII